MAAGTRADRTGRYVIERVVCVRYRAQAQRALVQWRASEYGYSWVKWELLSPSARREAEELLAGPEGAQEQRRRREQRRARAQREERERRAMRIEEARRRVVRGVAAAAIGALLRALCIELCGLTFFRASWEQLLKQGSAISTVVAT